MRDRQQNSTAHPITFLMVLTADHITGATGVMPTVAIAKDGGTFATPAGSITEIGHGWYALAGNATDRNTLGSFLLNATAAGCDPCDRDYTIVGYDPFDGRNLGLASVRASAAVDAGNLTQSSDGTTTTITDAGDPATIRITSVQTGTTRTVTIH